MNDRTITALAGFALVAYMVKRKCEENAAERELEKLRMLQNQEAKNE